MDELYVLEPGSTIRKDGDCLKIMRDRNVISTIPASGLKQLVMSGTASLSGAVLDFLITNRIDTVFMSPGGRFRARLLMDDAGHVQLRQRQYLRLADNAFKRSMAVIIVHEKLENQARLLLRRASQYNTDALRNSAVQIKALQQKLAATEDLDQVRGIEGYGAKLFYSVFGLLLRNDRFQFSGRNRRPPLDPINALLSFVYTLLTNEVLNGIRCAGLDPYLGALHEVASGRPALACDLVEEWRIFAERLVLTLINRRVIQPGDFVYRSPAAAGNSRRPVEMKPAVSRALIAAYHRQLEEKLWYPPTEMKTTVRAIIHGQCRRFAEGLEKNATPYAPFRIPR
ncbi:MAG: CRISPR-associated endonuclease Cas1 [Desulfobulbaceae bacterium]|nr:CRISPR-associated endonuclease Cas1 [Desulfobulbaceae bacterium]